MAWTRERSRRTSARPLDPVRAAILIVADGTALARHRPSPEAERVLPAARRLARAAGVTVELVRPGRDDADIVSIEPLAASGR